MSALTKIKRPASHRWAIGFLTFMTAMFILFLIGLFSGRSDASPWAHSTLIVFLSVGAIGLAALLFGGRRKSAYYVAAGALGYWGFRALYTMGTYMFNLLSGGTTLTTLSYHVAEQHKPFVTLQQIPWSRQVCLILAGGLFVWLVTRFVFGRPSRTYYGFNDDRNQNAG